MQLPVVAVKVSNQDQISSLSSPFMFDCCSLLTPHTVIYFNATVGSSTVACGVFLCVTAWPLRNPDISLFNPIFLNLKDLKLLTSRTYNKTEPSPSSTAHRVSILRHKNAQSIKKEQAERRKCITIIIIYHFNIQKLKANQCSLMVHTNETKLMGKRDVRCVRHICRMNL